MESATKKLDCSEETLYSDDEKSTFWKLDLYEVQNEAPKPIGIICSKPSSEFFAQYGAYYHGNINQRECQALLISDGNFLVRSSQSANGHITLSFRIFGLIKHYKLFFDGFCHHVGSKKFPKLVDLVGDGLVTLYLEKKVGHILKNLPTKEYHKSPHFTLTRFMQRFLKRKKKVHLSHFVEQTSVSSPEKGDDLELSIPRCFEDEYGTLLVDDVPDQVRYVPATRQRTSSEQSLKTSSPNLSNDESLESPHRFTPQSFRGLHWCGYCGNFLWGFVLQGVKCQDCGLQTHTQCSSKVPRNCCPPLKNFFCIFGMDLTTSLQCNPNRRIDQDSRVPQIVLECISEIDARGLTSEGIYRACGSQDVIESLRLSYERDDGATSLNARSVEDINAVAGLLKLYLRLLPLRLITKECLQQLVSANEIRTYDAKVAAVKESLGNLPECHAATLKVLIQHLSRVCDHSALNKMTATSLGTIFGPSIVQVEEKEHMDPSELLSLKISAQESRIVEMIIVMSNDLF